MSSPAGSHLPYTVVGAGAIGGTLAHALACSGHNVTIVDANAHHAAAITRDGIVIRRADGTQRAARVLWSGTPDEYDGPPLSRVLLATKAQATDSAAAWIASHLETDGFVVSLQNGLNEPVITRHVGADRTVGAFVNLFADVVQDGVIADGGTGALVIGELDGRDSTRVATTVADLQCWGPAKATGNVLGYLWAKLGFGAMLTATALADAPMAELIERHAGLMSALAGEVFEVSAAEGVRLEAFDAFVPSAFVRGTDPRAAGQATAQLVAWLATQPKKRSGIWRDIAVRRRKPEVYHHYRPVLEVAADHRIPCPLLIGLLTVLSEVESGDRPMSEQNLVELAGLSEEGTP
jgi:2-dehydropantoate 2-reductase